MLLSTAGEQMARLVTEVWSVNANSNGCAEEAGQTV